MFVAESYNVAVFFVFLKKNILQYNPCHWADILFKV